jgi:hypothetical protein
LAVVAEQLGITRIVPAEIARKLDAPNPPVRVFQVLDGELNQLNPERSTAP